jgi:ABC-2 type transport system ATP-binding protein
MVVQLHLALVAAIDARLMVLDEPTLGLDVLSRKAFYEMLIDEWCDGERSVLISTHQVEEESLLSDVLMLSEGRMVLNIPLAEVDERFVALSHDPAAADAVAAAHPILRYRQQGQSAALFDGAPPEVQAWASACGPAWWTCSSRSPAPPSSTPRSRAEPEE